MLQKEDQQYNYKSLQEYKKSNVDQLAIRKVSTLPLKHDKKSEEFLERLYRRAEHQGFRDYYQNMINSAIGKEQWR